MPNEKSTSVQATSGAVSSEPTDSARQRSFWSTLLREPLLHFFALGALIFAVHAVLAPPVDKNRLIEVDASARSQISETFKSATNRDPTPQEMASLIDVWILNEITYREALAQGLDRGDEMIRERIMQKMRLLIFDGLKIEDPSQEEITAWFEARRARYDAPDTVNFFAVPFTGPDGEEKAKAVLREIETGEEPENIRMRTQIFARRPVPTIEQAFGKPFVAALAKSPEGKWTVLQGTSGWYVVRLDSFAPGRKTPLAEIYSQVDADWKDEMRRIRATAAIRDIGKTYVIRGREP